MRGRAFIRQICGHTRLVLSECRRSEPHIFNFYRQLSDSTEFVETWVARAREAFPDIEGHSPINLVFSHSDRISLNETLLEFYRPRDVPTYWTEPGPCRAQNTKPQPMWLWLGQELYCASTHGGLRNRWTYVIVDLTETHAVLEPLGGGVKTSRLEHSKVASIFRLSYARTYHAAQGLEWPRVRLWGWTAPLFSIQHLLVGMSRSRSQLDFGPR
jgi:hypothetical protein